MTASIGIARSDALEMTLRELLITVQERLLSDWDKTAAILWKIDMFERTYVQANSKGHVSGSSPDDFHPFRNKKTGSETKISRENFHSLKDMWDAYAREKK